MARLRIRSQDLDPIRPDVVPPVPFRLDLGWHRSHSWLYFALGDDSAAERGDFAVSCRRGVSLGQRRWWYDNSWTRGIDSVVD